MYFSNEAMYKNRFSYIMSGGRDGDSCGECFLLKGANKSKSQKKGQS